MKMMYSKAGGQKLALLSLGLVALIATTVDGSACYTTAVEQDICKQCNWETRLQDCGDDKCWPESDVPVCNGQAPPPKSGCYSIALEQGICKHCTWDTRFEDCGDDKCWPEFDVPICNGQPVETGFCNNKEFGECVECTASNVQSKCGAGAACWSELDGCGDLADVPPGGFCYDTGGLNIDGECRKCSIETQCPGPTPASGFKCMSNVPGCFKENPDGNWIPPNPPDSPHISYKCVTPGHVALTFDDGPNRTATRAVMDKLQELDNTKATFFINGRWISGVTGPLLIEMESRGHTVASHTVNHASLQGKAEDAGFIESEVVLNEVLAGGYLTLGLQRYMRPPFLEIDAAMANKLGSMGYKVVQINVDTDDFREGMQSEHVMQHFDGVFKHADPSQHSYIILQHDAYAHGHLEAIEHVVTTAKSKGFTFVDMETCLGPVGAGPVGAPTVPSNVCAHEMWGKCTPCEATRCESTGGDEKCYDDLNMENPGCECWSEYPGCGDGGEPTGYCDTDDDTCLRCTWSNHCGAGTDEGACLDIKLGCSTLAEAHRNSIPLCYQIIDDVDTSAIPLSEKNLFYDNYGRQMDCPPGWKPASGTIYNSWPEPGTVECDDADEGGYNGCHWAGMFTYVQSEGATSCELPAVYLPRPDEDTNYQCRIPKEVVRNWKVASTWEQQPQLQNRKLRVMVSGGELTTEVNVIDTCSDNDCEGCCSMNSASGEYPLLDLEVGPAMDLLDVRRSLRGLQVDPSVGDIDEMFPPNERPVVGDPNLRPEVVAGLPFADGAGTVEGFSMIVSSDPQYQWYDKVFPQNLPDGDKEKNARRQIRQQYESMVRLANDRKGDKDPFQVEGVLINGDLTEFGDQHGRHDDYKNLVKTLTSESDLFKVYLALGNHDYENNVDECTHNDCASTMIKYMVKWLKDPQQDALNKAPFPRQIGSSSFYGSLAYSFNHGKVHFVQLQNYPSYTSAWENPIQAGGYFYYRIAQSLDWLEHDLALARNRGDIIIVSLHDYGGSYNKDGEPVKGFLKSPERDRFDNDMETYGVSAVFAGHIHEDCGKVDWPPFPFFRSGSASTQQYLVADIDVSSRTMEVWRNHDPTLNGEYEKGDTWTVSLRDDLPETPLHVPPRMFDGFVSFFNEGGYDAEFQLDYKHNGEDVEHKTNTLNLGEARWFDIPGDATDIRIRGWSYTGLVWDRTKEIFDDRYAVPPLQCYKTWGTTLNPLSDDNYCGFF